MRARRWYPAPMAGLACLVLIGCDKPTMPEQAPLDPAEPTVADAEVKGPTVPFDVAQVFFEFNTTDDDLGLQLFLDAEGWRRLRVLDPARNEVVLLTAEGRLSTLGITELRFESAEPSPAEVLRRFPPGEYRFRGRSVEGEQLASNAILSHDFLPAPTFSPADGEVVDPRRTVVHLNAPGAEQVELIIEHEDLGHVLDITLPGTTRRLRVPPQFLLAGEEYKIEVLSISENGNRTIAESTFQTAR